MPGAIVGNTILTRLHLVNLAGVSNPADKPKLEAFRASEGRNAARIQDKESAPVQLDPSPAVQQ
jgi:hypothetical protein